MIALNIEHVSKSFGAELILEDVHFDIQDDARIGLIGRNGAGKTTLFRVICGQEDPSQGFIHRSKGLQIGYLEQIPQWPDKVSVRDVLMTAFHKVLDLRKKLHALEVEMSALEGGGLENIMHAYDLIQKQYEIEGGYEIDEKLGRIVTGLKLGEFLEQDFETLSGGEKTRSLLGKLLLESPGLLLLDEPTNHLDVESVEWLEGFLKEYSGAVVIISHDRYFLDRTVTRIIELELKRSRVWIGNYTDYMAQKDEWLRLQLKAYASQQRKIRAMEEAIARFRQWGTNGDNEDMFVKARSMEKRIDRMEKIDKPFEDTRNMRINFQADGRSGKEVILLENISAGYEGSVLFEGANLDVRYKDRIALVGRNGAGKSTLFSVILSKLAPLTGYVKLGANVKVGYLAQEIAYERTNRTVLTFFNEETGYSEGVCRSKLARFLFVGEDVFKTIDALSGGERVRLKLCLMMETGINLLIMDEPTNHVDIPSREMLELALEHFEGTILFISHDRYLINRIADRIADLTPKGIDVYEGNYETFKTQRALKALEKNANEPQKNAKNYRDQDVKRLQNQEKKRLQMIASLEFDMAQIETEIEDLEALLSDSGMPYESMMKRYDKLNALRQAYDTCMEKWIALQEA